MTRMMGRLVSALAATLLGTALLASPALADIGGPSYQFIKAVKEKDLAKVNTLLNEPGAAIIDYRDNDTGEGALHMVVKRRDLPWLNYLLSKGANPNLEDGNGNTPLILAASQGFADGVRSLVAFKADVNGRNRAGETPLIKAVQALNVQVVRILMAAGADPDLADHVAGYSAIDYAERNRRAGTILRLMKNPPKAEETAAAGE
ncbi:ankyrin repeat domain-containing protein [Pedomonas mirosovicensis]|uniref:ankyrin repeat domain-containing protein n=1 Tax=Pedomonas mirosovicensis TaxID=2908641 RepID=UPI00216A9591|nr:ankyrin repeat domain-containing protein [Pedomonas mirosovicensis]MCH8684069.1 ankyrin repeat domain-containing protein [Pedomonas mirosovicensis]